MPKYNDLINGKRFADAHWKMQELATNLKEQYQLDALFNEVIYEQEIAVSPAAQLLLILPVIEAMAMQDYWQQEGTQNSVVNVDVDTIRQSLRQLVREAKNNPARADRFPDELTMEDSVGREWPMRSSFSIIKSFFSRFCNIPPFCSEKTERA
jgi:hypothetical protein